VELYLQGLGRDGFTFTLPFFFGVHAWIRKLVIPYGGVLGFLQFIQVTIAT